MSSYFYSHAEKNSLNADFLTKLQEYADVNKTLLYVLDRPLTDLKYKYEYTDGLIVLSPKNKIAIINYGSVNDHYENYIEDIIEDIGSISDKYEYKGIIGRPRTWRESLIEYNLHINEISTIKSLFKKLNLSNDLDKKKVDLLISLFIGSINDMDVVKDNIPVTLLDKVKQKIQLFDGDQTRFIYNNPNKKVIKIQGLSGTGKTELLLHKLKDLYTKDPKSRIFFTCFNKILADNLRKRIPAFFNFMKVEQQIEWEERLWCTSSWGSRAFPNSGTYRYICAFYQIPFFNLYQSNFEHACKIAIESIKSKYESGDFEYAFTYMFIDESQDFEESFFELCELVTEKTIYIAGDIFQSIFDENISKIIEPDFLLGKCYRTDPKTLMFAHALGMGLFEKTKLRWLEEKEWEDCGYNVTIDNSKYYLKREPIRRFEDIDENFESLEIVEITDNFSDTIINLLADIKEQNNTLQPEDIGIILLDQENDVYRLADILEIKIQEKFNWKVNKAYETKEKIPDQILISNRNNVKGLEFPFVICVTKKIQNTLTYRNSLYTMLTRSFIKSYLAIQPAKLSGLSEEMKTGLKKIMIENQMVIQEPSEREKDKIRTRFKNSLKKVSHYDTMMDIFKRLKIDIKYHDRLLKLTLDMGMIESDNGELQEFVKYNLKYLKERK